VQIAGRTYRALGVVGAPGAPTTVRNVGTPAAARYAAAPAEGAHHGNTRRSRPPATTRTAGSAPRRAARTLARTMDGKFAPSARGAVRATIAGRNLVQIAGRTYRALGVVGAPGAPTTVRNIGTPAAARYAATASDTPRQPKSAAARVFANRYKPAQATITATIAGRNLVQIAGRTYRALGVVGTLGAPTTVRNIGTPAAARYVAET
jgi:hypothetical protein